MQPTAQKITVMEIVWECIFQNTNFNAAQFVTEFELWNFDAKDVIYTK